MTENIFKFLKKISFMKQKTKIFTILMAFFLLHSISFVKAEDEVSFGMRRDFGTGIGDKIQGKFTISCSCSDEIVEMHLLFNGT